MKKMYKKELPFSINQLIKSGMRKNYISRSDLKEMLNLSQPAVHNILNKSDMQITRLFTICKALDVNIFRQIADAIDIEYPTSKQNKELAKKNQQMQERIAELEKECEILRDVIGMQRK